MCFDPVPIQVLRMISAVLCFLMMSRRHARHVGQTALAYQAQGYPWARLGYTYNWNPNADEVGVNEFVVRRGADVKASSVTTTVEYCQQLVLIGHA
jgi:hypothetical protein